MKPKETFVPEQPSQPISEDKAMDTLLEVISLVDNKNVLRMDPPGLLAPGAWVIASESGPENWVNPVSAALNGDRQNGLFVERINDWSIAVYPSRCGCGLASRANWCLQLALVRDPGDGIEETQQRNLLLCADHLGNLEDHVPDGWTLQGKNLVNVAKGR